ncbi:MAG: crossover junction endodeoxyribonuclease RuvC [Candidatus Obscuribacterales bacterium]|nr:crossover junction endodeoxyribonuclease RuvC [Candidatus Obscuribacterales bacterium]
MRRILGIDPGTATVGFGVVEFLFPNSFIYVASGVISTPKTMTTGERLKMIREDILAIVDEYSPDETAVEALFFFKNAKTLVPVAQARGVILESLACRSHIPGEYTPMQVKLQISGYGKAEKADVQWSVAQLLGLSRIVKPDDASDALAIAVCHARMHIDTGLKTAAPKTVGLKAAGGLKAATTKSSIKAGI